MRDRYDLIVLGGGTGGLVSALIAAGAGASVALIERARPGGDCLWTGCVPSKSLLAAAELAQRMRHADAVGLEAVEPRIDFAAVMDHVDRARATIEPQDSADRLRREGIDVIDGEGRFDGVGAVSVGGRTLRFRKAIIATGAEPARPPIPGLESTAFLTSENLWELRTLPRRLAILGGGPIGCELAQGFARLGSAVTQVEMAPRLLLKEEPRASELVAEHLRSDGVTVLLDTRALAVNSGDAGAGQLVVRHEDADSSVDFDRLLVATGRAPRSGGLNLDAVGVRTDEHGAIMVNKRLRTTARHIYAVGDVTAALPFTHVAAYHARVAVVNALFAGRRAVRYRAVPWVTFTDPEVGRVGMTEQEARDCFGDRVVTTSFEYSDLDRAITAGVPYGFAKLVGDRKGRLVGATIAAVGGGEAVAELAAWISVGARIDRISQTVHAYPTFAEGPARAADQYLRDKLARPRMQAVTRIALRVLRALDSAS